MFFLLKWVRHWTGLNYKELYDCRRGQVIGGVFLRSFLNVHYTLKNVVLLSVILLLVVAPLTLSVVKYKYKTMPRYGFNV